MSRIGDTPISIPNSTEVSVESGMVRVKGSKGELTQAVPKGVEVKIEDGLVRVSRKNNAQQSKANHGLTRSLIANMIEGVGKAFTKKLELVGTGYRAKKQGDNLVLNVGYSQPVEYTVPEGISADLEGDTIISITGIDKQQVGHVAAEIRKVRKPEPYKGKGIRYQDELIRKKAGKATKVGASA